MAHTWRAPGAFIVFIELRAGLSGSLARGQDQQLADQRGLPGLACRSPVMNKAKSVAQIGVQVSLILRCQVNLTLTLTPEAPLALAHFVLRFQARCALVALVGLRWNLNRAYSFIQ